ncbi:MAG: transcription elongation factor GreA [Coriobacteriia bacterium]|nr:transcription elongation factor GreA [Coriobacteriia bacterium]
MAREIILTEEGREGLKIELERLETEKRAEVGERIKNAREFGDISENSEYDDAKNEQAWVESRIAEINHILANATVVEAPKRSNKVAIGNKVTVLMNGGVEREFIIVGVAEADAAEGKISNESPLGAALLGAHKGDEVVAEGPTGKEIKLTILKIGKK